VPRGSERFEVDGQWLSRRPNSPQWCRTWFDAATRQTRRASLGTDDLEAAKLALAEWVTLNARRERTPTREVVLGEVFARYWHAHGQHVRAAVQQQRNLFLVLSHLPEGITVAELTMQRQAEVARALLKEGYAPGTVKRCMAAAKAAVTYAWKNDELDRPLPFISLPDGEPRERVLTVKEMAALWDACEPPHLQAFLVVLLGTLARPEAALELTDAQCDLEHGLIDLNPPGKARTKKRRPVVPIPDFLRPWIEAAEGPVVAYRGRAVAKVNKTFRTIREEAGLGADVVPYTIRHTVATELRARGVPELEIAGLLGHAMPNIRTTGRYAKFRPDYYGQARRALDDLANEIGRLAGRPMYPNNEVRLNQPVRASSVLVPQDRSAIRPRVVGAGEGIRTLDPDLGKVVLYP